MSIESELAYLYSARNRALDILSEAPPEHVISILSFEGQLDKLNKAIEKLKCSQEYVRTQCG
ncbi:hypothetical protein J8V57_04805 [Xenorhabdus sp. PB61.4]|uniref:hypothetical protein n=1 Tax=Xenorhabdus sp. PB61.4 TaxID=2788940 RepID=UPI001E3A043A|nr:hypothetical protein [Xenorhabdus sp. PB61.4]MCC8365603.1 hypothetical protein [Xenorhabdus sp. PB61.4]